MWPRTLLACLWAARERGPGGTGRSAGGTRAGGRPEAWAHGLEGEGREDACHWLSWCHRGWGLSGRRMRPVARTPLVSSRHCHWGTEPSACGQQVPGLGQRRVQQIQSWSAGTGKQGSWTLVSLGGPQRHQPTLPAPGGLLLVQGSCQPPQVQLVFSCRPLSHLALRHLGPGDRLLSSSWEMLP